MPIPLLNRLRRRSQAEIALLQDEAIELLYGIDGGIVLHGGTAVWRCYGGNRFSEDLDFYCGRPEKIRDEFPGAASSRGLTVTKLKATENLVFCKLSNGVAEVRAELNFSCKVKPVLGRFERADGASMDVFTLSPGDLAAEKLHAYLDRRFIRDIYDVYHLSAFLGGDAAASKRLAGELKKAGSLPKPVDEKNLKALVYSGAIPSFSQMAEALSRRFK